MASPQLVVRIIANTSELIKNLEAGRGAIEAYGPSVAKMQDTWARHSAVIIEKAALVTAGMQGISASTLTANDAAANLRVLEAGMAQLQKTGQPIPAQMQALATELRNVDAATVSAASATDLFQQRWASFTAASGAAVISIQAVVSQLSTWLVASAAQENATVRLETALRSQGTFTPELAAQYSALADGFQRTTVNADELTMEMQALLVQVGNVMPEQMDAALHASMNLAAGLRIDLQTATMLVGKAFAGETGTLKRYGIVIDETALKTDGATAVLTALNDKFGGQAQAQAKTYTGHLAVLGNQFDNMKEQAGELLARAILPLIERFTALPQSTQTVILAVTVLAGVLVPLATAIAGIGAAVVLILPVLTAALPAAIAALAALLGPASLFVAAILGIIVVWRNWDKITEIAKAVYTGVKTWLVDKFDAIVASVKAKVDAVTGYFKGMYDAVVGKSYVPDMVTKIGAELQKLQTVMVQPAQAATQQTAGFFASLGTAVMGSMGSLVGGVKAWGIQLATNLITPLMNGLTQLQQRAVGIGGSIASALGGKVGGGTGAQIAGIASALGGAALAGSALGASITGAGAAMAGTVGGAVALGAATMGIGAAAVGVYALAKHFMSLSAEEKAGRAAADEFRVSLAGLLTDAQRLEAQTAVAQGANAAWAVSAITVRDAYLAAGFSAEEALDAVDRLWKAEQQGGDAVARVIDEIRSKMMAIPPVTRAAGDAFDRAATQGVIGFQHVQDTIRRLTTDAILSGNNSLIMAMHVLETQMEIAAENGVSDFAFMTAAIQAMKDQIALGISIPITLGPMPGIPNMPSADGAGSGAGSVGGGGSVAATIRDFLARNPGDNARISSALGIDQATVTSLGFRSGTPNLDFLSFPSGGAFSRLHGSEAVIPKGAGHQLAAEIAAAMPARGAVHDEALYQEMTQLRRLLERRERALPHLMSRMITDALATTTRR